MEFRIDITDLSALKLTWQLRDGEVDDKFPITPSHLIMPYLQCIDQKYRNIVLVSPLSLDTDGLRHSLPFTN